MSPKPARRTWAAALGQQLRIARERAGLDRARAAAGLAGDRDADWLCDVEHGSEAPSLAELYALAELYGATADVCVWPKCAPVAAPRT